MRLGLVGPSEDSEAALRDADDGQRAAREKGESAQVHWRTVTVKQLDTADAAPAGGTRGAHAAADVVQVDTRRGANGRHAARAGEETAPQTLARRARVLRY